MLKCEQLTYSHRISSCVFCSSAIYELILKHGSNAGHSPLSPFTYLILLISYHLPYTTFHLLNPPIHLLSTLHPLSHTTCLTPPILILNQPHTCPKELFLMGFVLQQLSAASLIGKFKYNIFNRQKLNV